MNHRNYLSTLSTICLAIVLVFSCSFLTAQLTTPEEVSPEAVLDGGLIESEVLGGFECVAVSKVADPFGQATATAEEFMANVVAAYTYSVDPSGPYPCGLTNVMVAEDHGDGTVLNCSTTMTVTDGTDPNIDCPGDISQDNFNGGCGKNVFFTVTANDNCNASPTVTCTPSSGSFFDVGTTTVNCTAADGSGGMAMCSFDVTIVDRTPPMITCPAEDTIRVVNDPGECWALVDDFLDVDLMGHVAISDDCEHLGLTLVRDPAIGFEFPVGNTTGVTAYALDAAGNTSATCTFTVKVEDVEDPVFTNCPSNSTPIYDPAECGAVFSYPFPEVDDNCPRPLPVSDLELGDIAFTSFRSDIGQLFSFVLFKDILAGTEILFTDNGWKGDQSGFRTGEGVIKWTADRLYAAGTHVTILGTGTIRSGNENANLGDATIVKEGTNDTLGIQLNSILLDNCSSLMIDIEGVPTTIYYDCDTTYYNGDQIFAFQGSLASPDLISGININGGAWDTDAVDVMTSAKPTSFIDGTNSISITQTLPVNQNMVSVMVPVQNITYNGSVLGTNAELVRTAINDETKWTNGTNEAFPPGNPNPLLIIYSKVFDVIHYKPHLIEGISSGTSVFPGNPGASTTTTIYSVDDDHGNSAECDFDVTVADDDIAPIINQYVYLDTIDEGTPAMPFEVLNYEINVNSGSPNANPPILPSCDAKAYFQLATTGACPEDEMICTLTSGDPYPSDSIFPVGTTSVTCHIEDVFGNSSDDYTFDVIVTDNIKPTVTCNSNIPVIIPASGTYTLVYDDLVSVSTDNCGIWKEELFPPVMKCSGVRSTPRTVIARATDIHGNVRQCNATVIVSETLSPSAITCPANINMIAPLGQCSVVVNWDDPGGGAMCTPSSGSAFPVGQTTVTCSTTDGTCTQNTCTFIVTVVDNQLPVIAGGSNMTVTNGTGLCGAVVSYTPPTATDNCSATIVRTAGLAPGATFPVGATTVTYTATDASGNTAKKSFIITVTDNEPPMINCPDNISVGNFSGTGGAVVTFAPPVGTDNCPGAITALIAGLPSGATFPVGPTTVTYRVTDAVGLTAVCSFIVTVNDTEGPSISCPSDITAPNIKGSCEALVTYQVPVGTDNSPGPTTVLTSGLGSGSLFPLGPTVETYTVTDAGGNMASCSFTILVIDAEDPKIECPGNITVVNSPGDCGRTVNYTAPVGTDNCEGASTSQTAGLGGGAFFPVGTTTETYTVIDATGKTASCSFTVTVLDTQAPTISCPANITENNTLGTCGAVVTYTVVEADNCPGATVLQTAGLGSGATFPVGTTTETYVVTDASGNSAACSFTVTILDAELPSITCPQNIVANSDQGICGAIVTYVAPIGSDNCPGATTARTAGPGSGAIFPVGTTTITHTVTDAAGNTKSCSFTVTVNDTEPPSIVCPGNITVSNDAGISGAVVAYSAPVGTDNCPGATTSLSSGLGSGATFPSGTTIETYIVVDAAANSSVCSFTVTVSDSDAPSIICPTNITVDNDPGLCGAVVNYAPPVGTDSSPGATTSQTGGLGSGATFPVGTTIETYTVTDANGNSTSCSFTVTVLDDEEPSIVCPADITLNNEDGICGALITYAPPVGVDNCPGAVTTRTTGLGPDVMFPIGTTVETYLVEDGSNNVQSCTITVTITNISIDPEISCPGDITVEHDPDACGAVVTYDTPEGTDNCAGVSTAQTSGLASGSEFPIGTTTNTFVVTDISGNTATCSFDVTVTEDEPPIIGAFQDFYDLPFDPDHCGAEVDVLPPEASDFCGIASIVNDYNGTSSGLDVYPAGEETEVTWTVTDVAGNTSLATATVKVAKVNRATNLNVVCREGQQTFKLKWTLAPGAQRYLARIRDLDGNTVLEKRMWNPNASSFGPLPMDTLPPGDYQWMVITYCKLDGVPNLPGWQEYSRRFTPWQPLTLPCTNQAGLPFDDDSQSIKLLGTDLDAQLYPNPTEGIFYLDTDMEDYTLELYDLKGEQLFMETRIKSGVKELDMQELPNGMYLLKIYNQETILTKRLTIQR